jgi:hypothetical protein
MKKEIFWAVFLTLLFLSPCLGAEETVSTESPQVQDQAASLEEPALPIMEEAGLQIPVMPAESPEPSAAAPAVPQPETPPAVEPAPTATQTVPLPAVSPEPAAPSVQPLPAAEPEKTAKKEEPVSNEKAETKPAAPSSVKTEEILLIDDFNGGVRSNLLGGAMGTWSKDEYDDTQSCDIDFVEHPRLGKTGGYSMKIVYDVDSPNPSYNGVWMKLDGLDARPYKFLTVYIKAPNSPPYGTDRVKIQLRNSKKETGSYLITRIPRGAWREYKIPLSKFKGLKDLSSLDELVIVFEDKTSNPKEGILFLENIYLTKGEVRRPQ